MYTYVHMLYTYIIHIAGALQILRECASVGRFRFVSLGREDSYYMSELAVVWVTEFLTTA